MVCRRVEHDELALHLLGLHVGYAVHAQHGGAEHDVFVPDEGLANAVVLREQALQVWTGRQGGVG